MAVKIRLQRGGKSKKAFYRIVAIDSRRPRNSKPIEYLGYYDPFLKTEAGIIKKTRYDYWLKCGAKPSERVGSILKRLKER